MMGARKSDGRATWRQRKHTHALLPPPAPKCFHVGQHDAIDKSFRVFAFPCCHQIAGIVRVDDPVARIKAAEETVQPS